jgi:hypothetical protein
MSYKHFNLIISILILFSRLAYASDVLVLVDAKAITSVDVNKRIEALRIANPELIDNPGLRNHILDNLINEELFRNEAGRLKIKVSDEEITAHLKKLQTDHNLPTYIADKLLKNESLRKQIEGQILWNDLVTQFLSHKIKVSDAEIRDEQKVRKDPIKTVVFKYIIFQESQASKILSLQQEESADCNNLDELSMSHGLSRPYKGKLAFYELSPELQSIMKFIPENKLSNPINSNGQNQVVMLCEKEVIQNKATIQEIRKELVNRKINAEAYKYLAELKKRVYIEKKK